MKKSLLLATLLGLTFFAKAQSLPKIFINLATHNEMQGEYYDTSKAEYDTAKYYLNKILDIVSTRKAKWNFQTCSKFVLGALAWENAALSSTDILETMKTSGYVEIDPRNKTLGVEYTYNISDVYHLLDSCGVQSTNTVGGFFYFPYNNEDWTLFNNVKIGAVYKKPWQANIIWGGGSPGHINDANDYGVWKPSGGTDSASFYTHDANKNLWLVGNGCAPVIYDTTADVQWIVGLIRENLRRISIGEWPADKFYSLTVMTNVKHMKDPSYLTKIQTVIDSIDTWVDAGKMEWAFITEKLTAFQSWAQTNNKTHSQWDCEEATAPVEIHENINSTQKTLCFPNPVNDILQININDNGTAVKMFDIFGNTIYASTNNTLSILKINTQNLASGIYFVAIENSQNTIVNKIIIEH